MALVLKNDLHKDFLSEGRRCPYTQKNFTEGDRVVFCARCKSAHLESAWDSYRVCAGCGCSTTGSDNLSVRQNIDRLNKPSGKFEIRAQTQIEAPKRINSVRNNQYSDRHVSSENTPQKGDNGCLYWIIAIIIILFVVSMCDNAKTTTTKNQSQQKSAYKYDQPPAYAPIYVKPEYSNLKLYVVDKCDDNYNIQYRMFDVTNNMIWPSSKEVYITRSGGENVHTLSCKTGATICFGASLYDSSMNRYWGVGIDGNVSYDVYKECVTCGDVAEFRRNLVCGN